MARIIITIFIVLSLMGCATFDDVIKQDRYTVDQLRTMAKSLLDSWPMYHGLVVGAFGQRLNEELPMRAVEAMMMLTEISNQHRAGELDDYQLGFSLGLRVQVAFSVVQEAIKQYAPNVFDLLPVIL